MPWVPLVGEGTCFLKPGEAGTDEDHDRGQCCPGPSLEEEPGHAHGPDDGGETGNADDLYSLAIPNVAGAPEGHSVLWGGQ